MEPMEDKNLRNNLFERFESMGFQPNWVLILPIFLLLFRGIPQQLMTKELAVDDLEKKARLLSRMKGYMSPEEQSTLHRAEMILHIISKAKGLFELPERMNLQTYDLNLSAEDRKRHMLMDISEFVDEEKQEIISRAFELHRKASTMESKANEIRKMSEDPISLENIEGYIDIFEPLLENDLKNKVKELRVMVSMVKLVRSMGQKKKLGEEDILEMVQSFMSQDQRKQMEKMVQIFKVVNALGEGTSKPEIGAEDIQEEVQAAELKTTTKNNELEGPKEVIQPASKEEDTPV